MRKYLVISVLLAALLWTISYVVAEEAIDFDPKVKEHLEKEYKMTKSTKEFAQSVEALDLSNLNLTSAKGLEYFTEVKELDLSENVLTDSSFLKKMNQLETVDLSYNQFETIEFASTEVKQLNLRANRLSTIEFVRPLSNLLSLNLRSNDIELLDPIEELEDLTYLNIRGNQVKSLEPLINAYNLTNLNARNNQIHSIVPIVDLPLSERLLVSGNAIDDFGIFQEKLATIEETDIELGLPKPIFSADSGVYTEPFILELDVEEGHEIYYTLDGSKPNVHSEKYDGSIEISEDLIKSMPVISNHQTTSTRQGYDFESTEVKKAVVINAVSVFKKGNRAGSQFSEISSGTFIFDDSLFNSKLPVISLVINENDLFDYEHGIYVPGVSYEEGSLWSGNYSKKGREYEREGIVSVFDETGEINFSQNIGVRINGNATRRYPQKSLRLYSRSEYGQSRIYTDVFNDLEYNEFNMLLLRNSGQDYNSTLIRDGLMQELVKNLNVDVQAYKPALVLINGEYWGIHNIREKYNKDYLKIKYNIREKDLVLMEPIKDGEHIDFEMKNGSEQDKEHYNELLELIKTSDMDSDTTLKQVEEKMDLENFLHFVAYQVYFANTDSFSSNLMLWRKNTEYLPEAPYGHDGRWRWMLYDLDWGMGYRIHSGLDFDGDSFEFNMLHHVLKDEERMILFRSLMNNEATQNEFIKIMLKLLNENFESNHVKLKVDELSTKIRPEIEQSIARWENIESVEQWEENLDVLYEFAEKRPDIVKQHLMEEFDLTEEDLRTIEESIK